MQRNIILLTTLLWVFILNAQQKLYDESKNKIINKESLYEFSTKLKNNSPVTILHIGDSHIQANFFTGRLRELFQDNYGKASRGITFPLRLAKTHGHSDIKFYSNIEWDSKKIIDNQNFDVGIAGATINTKQPSFYIHLINKENLESSSIKIIGKGLQKLKIGTPKSKVAIPKPHFKSKIYKVRKGDYLIKIARKFKTSVKKLKKWNQLKNSKLRIGQKLKIRQKELEKPVQLNLNNFNLITPTSQSDEELRVDLESNLNELFIISNKKTASITKIDGVFINNSNLGVTYHSVGINGAKFSDYNTSELFFKQLQHVNPDLIIISLGTNTAFDKNYLNNTFATDAETFIKRIKQNTSCDKILITTPPSSLFKKKYKNQKLKEFSNILKEISLQENYAIWNLLDIMGITNIKYWYANQLAAKDRIHYTKNGYTIQADLLFKALTND